MSQLCASIHDVCPTHLDAVKRLRDGLDTWGVRRVTLLAVPDYHRRGRLVGDAATLGWLRARHAAGDEIALHGAVHLAERRARRRFDRLRARAWTAGEGECLAQSPAATQRMLRDERRALEDGLGAAVDGFVAPAWLEPTGFGLQLAAAGFAWHEGSTWVEDLREGRRFLTPVVGFATRSAPRRLASLAWAPFASYLAARRAEAAGAPARLALHPADLSSPNVVAAAAVTARMLTARLGSGTYATALKISATRREVNAAL